MNIDEAKKFAVSQMQAGAMIAAPAPEVVQELSTIAGLYHRMIEAENNLSLLRKQYYEAIACLSGGACTIAKNISNHFDNQPEKSNPADGPRYYDR